MLVHLCYATKKRLLIISFSMSLISCVCFHTYDHITCIRWISFLSPCLHMIPIFLLWVSLHELTYYQYIFMSFDVANIIVPRI